MAISDVKYNVAKSLIISNLVSVVLFGLRIVATHNTTYWFLFWNLLLAWMPVLFAWLLIKCLRTQSWREPLPVLLTLLWLVFLPNSFYLMSDLIHLKSTGDVGILFDVVLFLSCIWNGIVAGIISMYWVHKEALKHRRKEYVVVAMTLVIALVSFAMYLGRSLRWNTWDVVLNPAGLLFDVSERVINPLDHPQVLVTTVTFFVLIGSMYYVVWTLTQALSAKKQK